MSLIARYTLTIVEREDSATGVYHHRSTDDGSIFWWSPSLVTCHKYEDDGVDCVDEGRVQRPEGFVAAQMAAESGVLSCRFSYLCGEGL